LCPENSFITDPETIWVPALAWALGEFDDMCDALTNVGVLPQGEDAKFLLGLTFGATFVAMYDTFISVINDILFYDFYLPPLTYTSSRLDVNPANYLPFLLNIVIPLILEIIWFIFADVLASGGVIGFIAYMLGSVISQLFIGSIFGIWLNRIYIVSLIFDRDDVHQLAPRQAFFSNNLSILRSSFRI